MVQRDQLCDEAAEVGHVGRGDTFDLPAGQVASAVTLFVAVMPSRVSCWGCRSISMTRRAQVRLGLAKRSAAAVSVATEQNWWSSCSSERWQPPESAHATGGRPRGSEPRVRQTGDCGESHLGRWSSRREVHSSIRRGDHAGAEQVSPLPPGNVCGIEGGSADDPVLGDKVGARRPGKIEHRYLQLIRRVLGGSGPDVIGEDSRLTRSDWRRVPYDDFAHRADAICRRH